MTRTFAARASRGVSAFSLVVALGVAAPAWAQDGTAADAQSSTSAQPAARDPNEIVVTAQKREESIQDVPIAMSAFTPETLAAQKVEGGFDLMKAVPNLTFSKSNFSSYNLSIRGIGTKAVSTTTDPGVAVSFNNTAIIQNRLFEQEYFDVERVEVLRGPQGTLYGRNATAGVVNVISAKPKLNKFEGSLKGEVGNYESRRLVGMLNVPLIDDVLGIRVAGSMTKRDGYDFNTVTNHPVNGRDLWSTRVTLGFEPAPWIRANAIWERFREDDNRSRTGKQLCHRDESKTMIGSTPVVDDPNSPFSTELRPAIFSTGCKAGSLYDDDAYGTPNGLALPSVFSLLQLSEGYAWAHDANGYGLTMMAIKDPYGGLMQSRNLREIASYLDPTYQAKSDLFEFNLDIDLGPDLTLSAQSAYDDDQVYSFQDFNRFNTQPVFNDTTQFGIDPFTGKVSPFHDVAPGGIFCDPQIGCSNTMAGFDISESHAKQFTQEVRLASSFHGPLNFSFGANYTHYKVRSEYYIMTNVLTGLAMTRPLNGSGSQGTCLYEGFLLNDPASGAPVPIGQSDCPYIDPNPYQSIAGDGHNYFRSSNPYKLSSAAVFGELYWNIDPALKLTAGLRYTDDRKTFTPIPSQLLLAPTFIGGGAVARGYPAEPDIKLGWKEFTGRFGLDWKAGPHSLLYGFYSRGYKGGGMNPPSPGYATGEEMLAAGLFDQSIYDLLNSFGALPILQLTSVEYGQTFKPEFVNAFEIGSKNTFMNGRLTLNASAFVYDYKDYQVSQIRDRTAVNENFDALIWGGELQAEFEPVHNLRLNANIGYLGTRIGDGESSIDIMNRNLGNPDYTVVKPWAQLPSNCVVPTSIAEAWLQANSGLVNFFTMCGGVGGLLNTAGVRPIDPATGLAYDVRNYPELNGGAGLRTDLSGNQLPNSPHWTVNVGAQYTIDFSHDWHATIRGDGYWQGQSFSRVYNYLPYDRLRAWTNFNLSVHVDGPDDLRIEAYVKNLLNSTPITDAFLNSDDTGLTTNVFTLDPRIIGFSISKGF